jgi:hypothetical protein
MTDAILSLLSDTVSDDVTRETLRTALISADGKRLVATDGFSLVQIDMSHELTTACLGDRIDPESARKLVKAGKHSERKTVDLQFPEFARVIPGIISTTTDADGRFDANTSPSFGVDAVLMARMMGGIAKVSKAAGQRQAGVTFQTSSDGLTPCRIDATICDGEVTIKIVGVVMPMRRVK